MLSIRYFLDTGGAGATELASAVINACKKAKAGAKFKFLYPLSLPLMEKLELIAKEIYGAGSVELSETAKVQLEAYEAKGYGNLPVCMAKTHLKEL